MTIRYISPYYVGFCILSLFTGIAYETGTVVVRPFDILIGMGMLVAIGKACRRGSVQALRKGAPYYLFAILYLYRGISGVVWSEPVLGVKELLQGIEFIFLIHLVTHATKRPDDRRRFLRTLHVGLGIIAVVTALLHIVNGRYSGYKFLAELGYTATQPQKYAFGLFGLTAFVFWMGERKNVHTLSVLVVAILLCFLSGERKGWMALVAAVMAIYYAAADFRVWAMLRSVFRVRYLTVIGLIVLGSMLASNFEYIGENLESFRDTYEMVVEANLNYIPMVPNRRQDVPRYNGLVFIFDALSRHPIFGVGTGGAKEALDEIPHPDVTITTGHGEFQRYALENGLIGLFLYTTIWFLITKSIVNYFSKYNTIYTIKLFSFGFVVYSIVINALLGGGAHNVLFMSVSIGLLRINTQRNGK